MIDSALKPTIGAAAVGVAAVCVSLPSKKNFKRTVFTVIFVSIDSDCRQSKILLRGGAHFRARVSASMEAALYYTILSTGSI